MGRYKVPYIAYPNCPEATEYSRSRAYYGFYTARMVVVGSIGALIYFIDSTYKLFLNGQFPDFLYSLACVILAAALDLYFFGFRADITQRECQILVAKESMKEAGDAFLERFSTNLRAGGRAMMKETAKRFSLIFLVGALVTIEGIGIAAGIYDLCHHRQGAALLVCSVFGLCICAAGAWLIYRNRNSTGKDDPPAREDNPDDDTVDVNEPSPKYRKVAGALFYAGLAMIYVLLWDVAPGLGNARSDSHIFSAIIAIIFAAVFHHYAKEEPSKGFYRAALIAVAAVMVLSAGLRITYEAKLDEALADVPSTGVIYAKVNISEEFYTYRGGEYIENPHAYILIGEQHYQDGDFAQVTLKNQYPLLVGCNCLNGKGSVESSITFSKQEMGSPYQIDQLVAITQDLYAKVTITFTRVCDPWEVISYRPSQAE